MGFTITDTERQYLRELVEKQLGYANLPVMDGLSRSKIQLNVYPTSNVMLRVVDSFSVHPDRKPYDNGIPVT